MNIIIKPRGGGKTTEAIRLAAEHQYHIVCVREARMIYRKAQLLGLDIPFPITFTDFIKGTFVGQDIKGFIIDNLDLLLLQLSRGVLVNTITLSSPEIPRE